jgi:hypothetical protein
MILRVSAVLLRDLPAGLQVKGKFTVTFIIKVKAIFTFSHAENKRESTVTVTD